jgi:hypothetical protein
VQYNVPLRDKQGEIDVVGIDLKNSIAYVCEVATHTGGLNYVKGAQPDNVNKLTRKFMDDVNYARSYLGNFEQHRFMLWSPVVKHPVAAQTKHNQFNDLVEIRRNLRAEPYRANIEMIVNEVYQARVDELRHKATEETAASEYPVFRLLQILHVLEKHVAKMQKRGISTEMLLQQADLQPYE